MDTLHKRMEDGWKVLICIVERSVTIKEITDPHPMKLQVHSQSVIVNHPQRYIFHVNS